MMTEIKQAAAFFEYVIRPFAEDWRVILEKIKELNLPLSENFVRQVLRQCLLTHILLECLKWAVYVTITLLVCRTVVQVL